MSEVTTCLCKQNIIYFSQKNKWAVRCGHEINRHNLFLLLSNNK